MNTQASPQPHSPFTGATGRAADVRFAVEHVATYGAAEMAVELVLTHAPELRTWAADTLTLRGFRAAAARLRIAPPTLAARLAAAQNSPAPTLQLDASASAPALIPLDVELARLMVASGVTPAIVLTYWIARAAVSDNANAGGRIRLTELTTALHRAGLRPAKRTLDNWIKRGEAAELWRSHGKGQRRALYIRGHRRLCAHYTAQTASARPAAVVTNLPGKLWAALELDGSPLTAADILGKFWQAWLTLHPRTNRLSHATERDLWNRSRLQLDAARRAVYAARRGGYITHPHELPPAHAFPKGFKRENGIREAIPTTWAANAYAFAPAPAHRRARRSNYAAYTAAAIALETHAHTHAPAIDGATGQPGRVPASRVYFERGNVSENARAAARAIARQRTDTARAKVGQRTPGAFAAPVDVYEQFVVSDGAPVLKTPAVTPYRTGRRWHSGMLTRADEDKLFGQHGGRAAMLARIHAPHGASVPRARMGGVCA